MCYETEQRRIQSTTQSMDNREPCISSIIVPLTYIWKDDELLHMQAQSGQGTESFF